MKKLTAVFITLIFAYTGFGQGYFRIHAGPVFNYLDAEGDATFSNVHTGVTFGVGYEMVAAKNFSIQPELNYIHLSTEENVTNATLDFNYIQLPVLLKAVNSKRTFSFYVGPQFSFLTKANIKMSGTNSDIKNDLTQNDFSGLLGLEYVTPINLTINARFTQGFSNVYKAEFNSDIKTRHQIFAVTVGYIFNKKK